MYYTTLAQSMQTLSELVFNRLACMTVMMDLNGTFWKWFLGGYCYSTSIVEMVAKA